MAETTIRDFHDDDVWRDDQGTIWVRLEQLITALAAERDRADRAEARIAQIWDEGFAFGWHSDQFRFDENPHRSEATA